MLAITGIIVVIVILRRRSERKHVIATGTFDNASPPVKRHKKPHANDLDYVDAHNDVFDVPTSPPSIALAMLTYRHEPCPPGTPPPPEPTSFQAASSPLSTNSPPSYSDLEDVPPTNSGFTNQIPSCGQPHENSDTQLSLEDIYAPLKFITIKYVHSSFCIHNVANIAQCHMICICIKLSKLVKLCRDDTDTSISLNKILICTYNYPLECTQPGLQTFQYTVTLSLQLVSTLLSLHASVMFLYLFHCFFEMRAQN